MSISYKNHVYKNNNLIIAKTESRKNTLRSKNKIESILSIETEKKHHLIEIDSFFKELNIVINNENNINSQGKLSKKAKLNFLDNFYRKEDIKKVFGHAESRWYTSGHESFNNVCIRAIWHTINLLNEIGYKNELETSQLSIQDDYNLEEIKKIKSLIDNILNKSPSLNKLQYALPSRLMLDSLFTKSETLKSRCLSSSSLFSSPSESDRLSEFSDDSPPVISRRESLSSFTSSSSTGTRPVSPLHGNELVFFSPPVSPMNALYVPQKTYLGEIWKKFDRSTVGFPHSLGFGNILFAPPLGEEMKIYDLKNEKNTHTLIKLSKFDVIQSARQVNENILVTLICSFASKQNKLKLEIWDLKNNKIKYTIHDNTINFKSQLVQLTDKHFAVISNSRIQIFNIENEKYCTLSCPFTTELIALSDDLFITSTVDGSAFNIYDFNTGKSIFNYTDEEFHKITPIKNGFAAITNKIGDKLYIWDSKTREIIHTIVKQKKDYSNFINIIPLTNGYILTYGLINFGFTIINPLTGEYSLVRSDKQLDIYNQFYILSLLNGRFGLVLSDTKTMEIWDSKTGKILNTISPIDLPEAYNVIELGNDQFAVHDKEEAIKIYNFIDNKNEYFFLHNNISMPKQHSRERIYTQNKIDKLSHDGEFIGITCPSSKNYLVWNTKLIKESIL